MNRPRTLLISSLVLLATAGVSFPQSPTPGSGSSTTTGSTAPYTEGSIWNVSMIRTKAGMTDDYLKNLAKNWRATLEESKKQGHILDYKVLLGEAANQDDFDILLMVEYKNWAAFDGLRAKTDPVAAKLIGTEDVQRQGATARAEIREILGAKNMQEVTLK